MLSYFFSAVSLIVGSGLLSGFFVVAVGSGLVSLVSYIFSRKVDY